MPQLSSFSLKYDCTRQLVQALARTCGGSLRLLDVEYSMQVSRLTFKTETKPLNLLFANKIFSHSC